MNRKRPLRPYPIVLAVVAVLAPVAGAAPPVAVGNGCDYPTIAAGIAAASPGGVVLLEGGRTFEENDLLITMDLTLRGGFDGCASGSTNRTEISGGDSDRIFEIDGGLEVHLENLELSNGSTSLSGGGIKLAQSGGGLLVLDNVAVRHCDAGTGGGVWVGPDARLVANDVEIRGNNASRGGAVRLYGGSASLRNCTLVSNRADRGGAVAGIEASGYAPALSISDGTVLEINQAYLGDGMGGGVYLEDGELVVGWDTLFANNGAVQGGGVRLLRSLLRGGGQYYQNSATENGGALYATESTVEMVDGPLFAGNDADSGGAAYLTNWSTMNIRDGAVRGNTASKDGGAFAVDNSSLEITRTPFTCRWSGCHQLTDNVAGHSGGAIAASSWGRVHLEGQLFANNSASDGGALSIGDATVVGCVFAGNDATVSGYGDAIRVVGGTSFSGIGVTLAFNDAGGGASGNAIHVDYLSSVTLHASIVWGHGLSINDPDQSVTCSNVEGGYTGAGNVSIDPQFVSPLTYDFHLEPTSPLIDRCTGPGGRSGDWDWQVRPWVVDDPATPHDMGADEVDSISIGIFADGFESGDVSGWPF